MTATKREKALHQKEPIATPLQNHRKVLKECRM